MTYRVLFVDDEPSVTTGIRAALRKAPFEILTANSGHEALEKLANAAVDVVVSDERMPGMSGSELLARIRAEYPDTVRMILSGQADLQAAVRAINEGGIFRFLLKPCSPQDLASSVGEALESLENRRRFNDWRIANKDLGPNPASKLDRSLQSLALAFQPIFERSGTEVCGYEALVRVKDPDVTTPEQLFGLAEAVGRVADTDAAIRAVIAPRMAAIPQGINVFVNVHPESLLDERIYSPDDALAPSSERVVLEITERSSLLDTDRFEACVARLRARGYRIALDDLGAGYAGLSSFALLTPDVVKFDMALIRGLHRDPTRARLVESMAALCREMDIHTVAEGVETEEELRCVLNLGCDWVQGYLLGPPAMWIPGEAA